MYYEISNSFHAPKLQNVCAGRQAEPIYNIAVREEGGGQICV